jgi:hypothetical protein
MTGVEEAKAEVRQRPSENSVGTVDRDLKGPASVCCEQIAGLRLLESRLLGAIVRIAGGYCGVAGPVNQKWHVGVLPWLSAEPPPEHMKDSCGSPIYPK